jgi:D-alanyl-lipoteichoic acid acyltransferase DltB (MBOAT superfamily)
MSFVSPEFLLFLCAALPCYFAAPSRFRWMVLLAASGVFYWFSGGFFALGVIGFTTATVFLAGLWAGRLRERGAKRPLRRLPLFICLTLNFSALAFLKFGDRLPFVESPMFIAGVSFYTFQAAGYLIDVYRGKDAPERNPFRFALFVSFFPQLIQGPISRRSQIARDLYAGRGWDWDRAKSGVSRAIWGCFAKMIVADCASVFVDAALGDYQSYGGAVLFTAMIFYSVQIYADFSGGTNIAIGIAEIFGVSLPENFRQPFFAGSLADYWRRWHITLGAWLKDYLFYPLALSKPLGRLSRLSRKIIGGRIGKMLPTTLATFAVYLVVGLWHDLRFKSVAFGLLNGGLISLSLYCEPLFQKLRSAARGDALGSALSIVRTQIILVFLRYFTRAPSFMTAINMIKRPDFFQLWDGTLLTLGLGWADFAALAFAVLLMLARDAIAEKGVKPSEALDRAKPIAWFAFLFAVIAMITLRGIYREGYIAQEFIYGGH